MARRLALQVGQPSASRLYKKFALIRSIMRYQTLIAALITLILSAHALGQEPTKPPGLPSIRAGSPELTAKWWQWAMSTSKANSPVADSTGAHCAVNQTGDVWFLAGGYGSSKIRRTCTVPAGKALFFPLINMVYWPTRGTATFTCERAKDLAALNNDAALDLFADIDGAALPHLKQYRIASEQCFDVFARVPPPQDSYKAYPSATDGYWLLVGPLASGRHVLKFGGRYNRNLGDFGRMVQDIEYVLLVE